MEYITNSDGDVKVRTAKGVEKWLPKALVENKFLMKGQHLEIVPAPKSYKLEEPIVEEEKVEPVVEEEKEESIVADDAPAKRGRKPKTN